MINQRAYPDILLGTGSGNQTIANYGCYECSLLQGLLDRGYSYTVAAFDEFLTGKKCFSNNTSLSASVIAQNIPEIFLEGRNEAWSDAKVIEYIKTKKSEYIVLGEVDARGIGGSGQHFVYIQDVDVTNGQITMTYVGDPWGGLEKSKVTTRYNEYKNILSLRVFKIKKSGGNTNMANMYKGYDLSNPDSMKVAVDVLVRVQAGEFVEKTKHEADLKKIAEDNLKLMTAQEGQHAQALKDQEKRLNDQFAINEQKIRNEVNEELTALRKLKVDLEAFCKTVGVTSGLSWPDVFKELKEKIDKGTQSPGTVTPPASQIVTTASLSTLISAMLAKLLSGNWSEG